jgi:hypothetical protein
MFARALEATLWCVLAMGAAGFASILIKRFRRHTGSGLGPARRLGPERR